MKRQSVVSKEFVEVPVIARADPTTDVIKMAFVAEGTVPDLLTDFNTGSWDPDDPVENAYIARCLVGPGGTVELDAGVYDVYVWIVDSPESPALFAGKLKVF